MQPFLRRIAPLIALGLAAVVSHAPANAAGYTLRTLHTFSATDSNGHNADGAHSYADVTLDGMGHLYGTAGNGGTSGLGTLFEYDIATKTFATLINFTGPNGQYPDGNVVLDGQGHLYGTTSGGGTSGKGTLFEFNLSTKGLTSITSFNGTNGAYPFAGVTMDDNGNLFGTTNDGGTNSQGTVFELTPNS